MLHISVASALRLRPRHFHILCTFFLLWLPLAIFLSQFGMQPYHLCLNLAQSDHSSRSMLFCSILSFGFTSISRPHSSQVFLQAMDSSISFTSAFDKPLTPSILISCHQNSLQHILIFHIQLILHAKLNSLCSHSPYQSTIICPT